MNLLKILSNISGWRTNKKLIVFESDDWGSVRMPSKKVFNRLSNSGVNMGRGEGLRYNLYDTLASSSDLASLFGVLSRYKDINGRSACFTAISLVGNPDFQKIRENKFDSYYWESFLTTQSRYGLEDAWTLWNDGERNNLFIPEFHGREHLNVPLWMRSLQNNDIDTLKAFDENCWGFINSNKYNINYQAAFDVEKVPDIDSQKSIVEEGLAHFEKLYGRKARLFVPPNGPINSSLELTAVEKGIEYISTAKLQRESLGEGKKAMRVRYLGMKGKYGQKYITRNCFFEPSDASKNWLDSCLYDISIAFKYKKPAIISTHRVNYVGGLDERNRDNGLNMLNILLKEMIKNWPDIEFISTAELGDLIAKKKRND